MSTDTRYSSCPQCPAVVPWLEMDEHLAWHTNRGDNPAMIPDRLRLAANRAIEKFRDERMRDWHFTQCAYCPGVLVEVDQLSEHLASVHHRRQR